MKRIMMLITMVIAIFNYTFSINMSTTVFDQRIDTGGYREIVFKNNGNKPVRYKFTVQKFGDKKDMSQWIRLYPKVMNIPPAGEKVLKIYAKSPKNTEVGEYSFALITSPIVIPSIQESKGKIVGNSSISFTPVIEMLGYVGEPNFSENLILTNLKLTSKDGGVEITGKIENRSFAGIHIGMNLFTANDHLLTGDWLGRISKNSSDNFKIFFPNLKNKNDIKKIVIYDSTNLKDLKTIVI